MPQKDFVLKVGDTLLFDMETATHRGARRLPKVLGKDKRRVPVETLVEITGDKTMNPALEDVIYGVDEAAGYLVRSTRQLQRTGLLSEPWTRWIGDLPGWNVNSLDWWWANSYQPQCSENKRR